MRFKNIEKIWYKISESIGAVLVKAGTAVFDLTNLKNDPDCVQELIKFIYIKHSLKKNVGRHDSITIDEEIVYSGGEVTNRKVNLEGIIRKQAGAEASREVQEWPRPKILELRQ